MKAKFLKDEVGDWYIHLPEYPGPKEDLQMVCGADTLLDIMSEGLDEVNTNISEVPDITFKYVLTKKNDTPEIGGALYYISSFHEQNFEVWLCDVTRFVFDGQLPETIYFG